MGTGVAATDKTGRCWWGGAPFAGAPLESHIALKRRVVEVFAKQKRAKQWHDYGPTLAAEELARDYQLVVSKETLRHWLIEAELWQRRRAHVERAHVWRARRARYGELVQWDTSEHDWLEGRGEKLYLIAMIDDATSRLSAGFVRHDSTEENLKQLRSYIVQHGRPISVYTDKASLFQVAPRGIHHRDAPAQQLTQIGRALKELNVEWIAAHSPQANAYASHCTSFEHCDTTEGEARRRHSLTPWAFLGISRPTGSYRCSGL